MGAKRMMQRAQTQAAHKKREKDRYEMIMPADVNNRPPFWSWFHRCINEIAVGTGRDGLRRIKDVKEMVALAKPGDPIELTGVEFDRLTEYIEGSEWAGSASEIIAYFDAVLDAEAITDDEAAEDNAA